jgi:hypothetical protein
MSRLNRGWFKEQKGGAGLWIALVIISLAVVAGAISWFLVNGRSDEAVLNRKASEICEYGLMQILAHLKENPSWTGELPRTDYEGGWFVTSAKPRKDGQTSYLDIESVGHIGAVSRRQECVLFLTDSGWIRQVVR